MAVRYADTVTQSVTVREMIERATYQAIGAIESVISRISERIACRMAAERLQRMPDHLLIDIGVERGDIRRVTGCE